MTWHPEHLWGWHPAVTTGDDRDLGQRAADRMKTVLACWPALFVVVIVIIAWMATNGAGTDVEPWILLNLCLSCFAALQCFILLIANKRGEQIAAEIAQHTYDTGEMSHALLEQNTALTEEVHRLTTILHAQLCADSSESSAPAP